jgi:hypothetical protein
MDGKDSLIDRIEEVKKKIAEFENNLNISSIDIDRITVDKNSELINQIESYKKRINNIEKDVVKSHATYPIEQEPLLSSKKIETINLIQPEIKNKDSYSNIKKTIDKVEMEKQEVEKINDLLEKLKKNAAEQKRVNLAPETRTIQNNIKDKPKAVDSTDTKKMPDYTSNPYIKSSPVNKVENYSKASDAASNTVTVTENDLHSISELISRLDELLKSNKDLSDKLNELLKEQKADNSKISKNDELIKKLAILGSNGNLS